MTPTHQCERCGALADRATVADAGDGVARCWSCGAALLAPLPAAPVARAARAVHHAPRRVGVAPGRIAGHVGRAPRARRRKP